MILQPHSPGNRQNWRSSAFPPEHLPSLIRRAREILPPEITIQIPPNLIPHAQLLLDCLDAGAQDLGGISPIDEVNPSYAHLSLEKLQTLLNSANWQLSPRLPIYAHHDHWLESSLQVNVEAFRQRLKT